MFIYYIVFTGKCKYQAESYEIAETKFINWAQKVEENENISFEPEYIDEVDVNIFQITFYGGYHMKAAYIEEAIAYFRYWARNFKITHGINDISIDIESVEKEDYSEEG